MNTVTYKEASSILGVALVTIHKAIGRALTKVPTTSQTSLLMREQVELFKGKRLSLSALNASERAQWEQYRAMATTPARESEVPQGQNFTRAAPPMELLRVKGTQEQIAAFYQTLQTA